MDVLSSYISNRKLIKTMQIIMKMQFQENFEMVRLVWLDSGMLWLRVKVGIDCWKAQEYDGTLESGLKPGWKIEFKFCNFERIF